VVEFKKSSQGNAFEPDLQKGQRPLFQQAELIHSRPNN
jgi:hypothetical protein